ncbi:hypothetical protein DFO77_10643 [Marinilabilia salmonicolor]|jgi:hypothetical protein|uniref:Uncharacterized protein n=1 Tax=Marinilabilia salmonicolor TaxID=989 RepID=A0A2T0XLU7_9BACT|nr:hypothetical protein BY457_108119 [Marinilabilia salmonicolor]RCW37351.1 hypothetical protein DFO77_10643 [Marinilabilia salmonicolor]
MDLEILLKMHFCGIFKESKFHARFIVVFKIIGSVILSNLRFQKVYSNKLTSTKVQTTL